MQFLLTKRTEEVAEDKTYNNFAVGERLLFLDWTQPSIYAIYGQ